MKGVGDKLEGCEGSPGEGLTAVFQEAMRLRGEQARGMVETSAPELALCASRAGALDQGPSAYVLVCMNVRTCPWLAGCLLTEARIDRVRLTALRAGGDPIAVELVARERITFLFLDEQHLDLGPLLDTAGPAGQWRIVVCPDAGPPVILPLSAPPPCPTAPPAP